MSTTSLKNLGQESTPQKVSLNRRGFLKASAAGAAGLMLSFALPESNLLEAQFPGIPKARPDAYIHIATDGTVTFILPKSEMGQGPLTSLSQLLADEMDADWSKTRQEFAPVDAAKYGAIQGVVGSMSIRTLWEPLRRTGATARAMLLEAAAQKWGVKADTLRTGNGFVINPANNARLNYGAIAEAANALPVPMTVAMKDPKDFKLIGKPVKRVDTFGKVTGQTKFGMDTRIDGMVYAVLARCPVPGGKVISFDDSKTKAVPGVKKVVQISNGVAVVADNTWSAMQGRKVLEVKWDEGAGAGVDTAGITKMFIEKTNQAGKNASKEGDAAAALAAGAKKLDAVYEAPFQSHSPMEPMNTTAHVTADKCEVWSPTQMQTFARDLAATASGLPKEKVMLHSTFMGGGFGRRGSVDYVGEAVELAKLVGAPVKLAWSREDDMQHDQYRPASRVMFAGAVDAQGNCSAFTAKIACPAFGGVRNGIASVAVEGIEGHPYHIPNQQIDYHQADTHIPVTYWRSVGYSQNTFFMESFIDELAAAAGKDPLEFRRKMLEKNPRMLAALNLAAEKAGWGKPLPAGHKLGLSVVNNIGSFTAQVAEVSVENGRLKIHKITTAVDCGHVVNPMILRQQMESGIAYGLAASLKGEITIANGRVQQGNFHQYDMLRIHEMPKIEVHIVPSTMAPGGIGEASTPGVAPAVANAIFAATGKRLRKLPLRNQDLA
jgi:isoquinoline 1-oxidoreductase beta subunit